MKAIKLIIITSLLLASCTQTASIEQQLKEFKDSLIEVRDHKLDSMYLKYIDRAEPLPDNWVNQGDSMLIDIETGAEIRFYK